MIGQREFKIGEWIFIQMKGFSHGKTIINEMLEKIQNLAKHNHISISFGDGKRNLKHQL